MAAASTVARAQSAETPPAAPSAAATPAPASDSAPATTQSTNQPQANVNNANGEKPKAKPAQRQVQTQGPRREPIRIPVNASGCKAARAPGKSYFVEFRSRTAVSYGHTFVFYGRLGEGNSFASFKVAGLHPKGDDPNTYLQGMMVPVPSETGVSWGDLDEQYLTGRFCVTLTEAEYRRVEATIRELQRTKTTWHATTYNCNAFAADIARAANLDPPNPNMYLPETFIRRMGELNRGGKSNSPFSFTSFQQNPEPPRTQSRRPQTPRAN